MGHRTYECFAHTTKRGTPLPKAPWTATGASEGKRKSTEEPEETPVPKQQKIAAVDTMELEDTRALPSCSNDSDKKDF